MYSVLKSIKSIPSAKISVLPSGLKVATIERSDSLKALGVFVKSGSRYAVHYPVGITQMIQRLAFKGIDTHPNDSELTSYFNKLCAQFACDYQRDYGFYVTKFYNDSIKSIIEILSKSVFNPIISNDEFNLQKNILKGELKMMEYARSFDEKFNQHLHSAAFNSNTVGLPNYPTEEHIDQIKLDDILNYFGDYLKVNRMAIAGVNIDHDELVQLSEEYFNDQVKTLWTKTDKISKRYDDSISQYTGGISKVHDPSPRKQPGFTSLPDNAYLGIGFKGPKVDSDDVFPFATLSCLYGKAQEFSAGGPGKGMYSRLNLNVMSRYHWIQSIEAMIQTYSDNGIFYLCGTCDPNHLVDFTNAILQEYYNIIDGEITAEEFSRAKRQLQSQLMSNLEFSGVALEDLGTQLMVSNEHRDWRYLLEKIEKVTVDQVKDICIQMLKTPPSIAAMGNLTNMPQLSQIQEAIIDRRILRRTWFS